MISNVPFAGPVGAVRIGKIDGNFVVYPSEEDLVGERGGEDAKPDSDEGQSRGSDLDLVVAGSEDAILMVEAGANEIGRGRDPRRSRHRARGDQEAVRAAA